MNNSCGARAARLKPDLLKAFMKPTTANLISNATVVALLKCAAIAEETIKVEIVQPDPVRSGRYFFNDGQSDPLGIRAAQKRNAAQGLAAARANANAQFEAAAERTAEGVEDRVIAFLRERIKNGSVDAALDLGERYERGKGVPQNRSEALKLYRLAAQRGSEKGTNQAVRIEKIMQASATNAASASANALSKGETNSVSSTQ